MSSEEIVIGAVLFEHDLFGKPDHALAHCLSMISAQNASPLLGSREGRCSSIGLGHVSPDHALAG
jgi:hypothetical protein